VPEHDVEDLARRGYTCSQIIMMMTMRWMGIEDEYMVRAVKGLTMGMGIGHACGIVTGAACALSLAHGARGMSELFPLFHRWFYERFGEPCGGINCMDLLDGDIGSHMRVCPDMIMDSWENVLELLERQ
jgi:C_GCAxxG_C_C family probable redox protein